MSSDPRVDPNATKPTAIKAPHGASVMEITWADGHHSLLPHAILRGFCPCAGCQGHGNAVRFIAGGNREIREIERVGLYALSLTWGDGHSSGIYAYSYLRGLCQCDQCRPHSQYREPDGATP